MAGDYENIHDIGSLSDRELRDLVRTHLADHEGVDADDVTVTVKDGTVSLEGRVGTEGEQRVAERIVTDLLGVDKVENGLVVDANRRAESPQAIDEHMASEESHEGLLLGDRSVPFSDESEHLGPDDMIDQDSTTDPRKSIEGAVPWAPPESPTQEGLSGSEAQRGGAGEDH
jgi:hypothetical protein